MTENSSFNRELNKLLNTWHISHNLNISSGIRIHNFLVKCWLLITTAEDMVEVHYIENEIKIKVVYIKATYVS